MSIREVSHKKAMTAAQTRPTSAFPRKVCHTNTASRNTPTRKKHAAGIAV